jgi:RNA polymerase sigma-70 factor (ECF subfamily)
LENTLTRVQALLPLSTGERAADGIAPEAFDALVRQHQRRIYRVLLGLVGDADAAETLTQECFLRAYQKRGTFRGESSIGTWLVRIAVNLAADHGRSPRQRFWRRLFSHSREEADPIALGESLPHPQASAERQIAARQELQAVWSAVAELSPRQRMVFVLRFAEEMSLEEMAIALELDIGTVKAHLSRAVHKIREHCKEQERNVRTSDR